MKLSSIRSFSFYTRRGKLKFVLFGTGDYYNRYHHFFHEQDVVAVLDNNAKKQGTYIDGWPIASPEKIQEFNFDAVVILSFYYLEMKAQLRELGVPEEKIFHFYDLYKLFTESGYDYKEDEKAVYKVKRQQGPEATQSVLLLSHDLNLGGPALALFNAAKVLQGNGYRVTFGSMIDGRLRENLTEEGIDVIVDSRLQLLPMNQIGWISDFDLVICNTINYHTFLKKTKAGIPIIWWLHDSAFFYQGIREGILENINRSNIKLLSVGSVPKRAFQSRVPSADISELLYAVADSTQTNADLLETNKRKEKQPRVLFTTIGYIEWRKGQDILLDAIEQLGEDTLSKCSFKLVGQDESLFADKLRRRAKAYSSVNFVGTVGRDEINNILENTDVLICPSREDPMPTVCAEAMMHKVPCLVSDATGTAEYIHNGIDGFIFSSESSEKLAEKIKWCVEHQDNLIEIGACARNIYEEHFTTEVFENTLMEYVRACLNIKA